MSPSPAPVNTSATLPRYLSHHQDIQNQIEALSDLYIYPLLTFSCSDDTQ